MQLELRRREQVRLQNEKKNSVLSDRYIGYFADIIMHYDDCSHVDYILHSNQLKRSFLLRLNTKLRYIFRLVCRSDLSTI